MAKKCLKGLSGTLILAYYFVVLENDKNVQFGRYSFSFIAEYVFSPLTQKA